VSFPLRKKNVVFVVKDVIDLLLPDLASPFPSSGNGRGGVLSPGIPESGWLFFS